MNRHRFLSVVPRGARIAALITGCCIVLIGAAVTIANAGDGPAAMLYCLAAALAGVFIATWILCVGFVYADARRRAMRPLLWAVLVIVFPHLLGFLLYFVLRQPLAAFCAHCGQIVSPAQRFCSWCGTAQAGSSAAGSPIATGANPGVSR